MAFLLTNPFEFTHHRPATPAVVSTSTVQGDVYRFTVYPCTTTTRATHVRGYTWCLWEGRGPTSDRNGRTVGDGVDVRGRDSGLETLVTGFRTRGETGVSERRTVDLRRRPGRPSNAETGSPTTRRRPSIGRPRGPRPSRLTRSEQIPASVYGTVRVHTPCRPNPCIHYTRSSMLLINRVHQIHSLNVFSTLVH